MSARLLRQFATVLLLVAVQLAHAELGVTATSDESGYVRGRTNTFTFRLELFSNVFELADNIHFAFPPGVTVSAARYVNEGFTNCPDALLLVLGMGTSDGGWFNPGHPSGCGRFDSSADGTAHVFSIDADVPATYVGDLPVDVIVEGDECCDPPPHGGTVTLTLPDTASRATWNFDEVVAPALSAGWQSSVVDGGVPWITTRAGADTRPNDARTTAPDVRGESILVSAPVAVAAAGGELRFRHRYATEEGRDGAVLEISIDGGAFEDIVAAGGAFRAGGYDGHIDDACAGTDANPLAGRDAWTGLQATYGTVAVTLPTAAAGHLAQFRWRVGTDCTGTVPAPNGWWLDGVVVGPSAPAGAAGPDALSASLEAGAHRSDVLSIGNVGGGSLDYTVTTASTDCAAPSDVSWLGAAASGTVGGGEHVDLPLRIDASALAAGTYSAFVCVAMSDAATLAMPVDLDVKDATCAFADRILANGFDDGSIGECGTSVRTFTRRDAFLFQTADGFAEDHYTGLRTGRLTGPIEFGNGVFDYSVFTVDGEINSLFLVGGTGVLSGTVPGNHVAVTFAGTPVTAFGGNFFGTEFTTHTAPATTMVVNFDDGRSDTFTTGRDAFRGYVTTTPIHAVSFVAPDQTPEGDLLDAVIDNVIAGRSR
ncbi:MAG TPA: hypothetical protein VKB52_07010 [Rhodanobacteraceae bacterium]|nr:hypothetical protein [Rhodanobacteraceae bacterium]